jgi:hypothetical protein
MRIPLFDQIIDWMAIEKETPSHKHFLLAVWALITAFIFFYSANAIVFSIQQNNLWNLFGGILWVITGSFFTRLTYRVYKLPEAKKA